MKRHARRALDHIHRLFNNTQVRQDVGARTNLVARAFKVLNNGFAGTAQMLCKKRSAMAMYEIRLAGLLNPCPLHPDTVAKAAPLVGRYVFEIKHDGYWSLIVGKTSLGKILSLEAFSSSRRHKYLEVSATRYALTSREPNEFRFEDRLPGLARSARGNE